MPLITVAIPLFNAERYIRETLDSVIGQTLGDFEVLVVDDGSSDASPHIVESFTDPRIGYLRQDNAGVSAARNAALDQARSPLVAFLDADDVWRPRHLEHLLAMADRFPQAGLVGNRFVEVASQAIGQTLARLVGDTDGTAALLGDYFETWARGGAPFCASSIMVRRDVALATGGFPFGHNRGEDLAFQARMAFRAPVAAGSYVGCLYRRTQANLRRMPVREADIAMQTVGERLRRQPPGDAARRLALSEFADRLAIGHALDCLVHDDVPAARRFLATARGTQWQRRRWWIANVLAATPGPLRRAAMAVADKARTLGTGATVK